MDGTSTCVSEADDSKHHVPSPTSCSQFLSFDFSGSPLNDVFRSVTLDSCPQKHAEGHLSDSSSPPPSSHVLPQDGQGADSTRTGLSLRPHDITKTRLWETMCPLVIVDYSPAHIISDQQATLYESILARSPDLETEGTSSFAARGPSQVSDISPDLPEDSTPRIHFRHRPGSWEYVAQSQDTSRQSLQWLVMKRQGNLRESWEFERSRDPPDDSNLQNFRFTFAQITGVLDGTMFERGRVRTINVQLAVPRKGATEGEHDHFHQALAKALTAHRDMKRFLEDHSHYIDSWEQNVFIQALVKCPLAAVPAPKSPREYQRYELYHSRCR